MDWLGFGVLIIGIAFSVLVVILIKPLNKLTVVLEGLEKTTDRLPTALDDGVTQAHKAFQNVNDTLAEVNEQVKSVQPVFHIIKDAGEASQQLTAVAVEKTMSFKQKTSAAEAFTTQKRYQGLYGILSFVFYLSRRKKDLQKNLSEINSKNEH